MLARLAENGYIITDEVDGVDAVIINTCGFIEDAKKEAEEIIKKAQARPVFPRPAAQDNREAETAGGTLKIDKTERIT